MKVLKKQWLTLLMLAALIVTLTLGVVFALPAKTASADEDVFNAEQEFTVTTEDDLKAKITEAGFTPTLIKLDANIELKTAVRIDLNQTIAIDLDGHSLSRAGYVLVNWWGNLYLQDSSTEQTGTVESLDGSYTMAVIFNYGNLTTSVNIYGRDADYIFDNELTLNSRDEYVCNPSLTILKGTIQQEADDALICSIDGDVTIKGGTFIAGGNQDSSADLIEVSSTELQPDFFPWDYLEGNTLTPEGQKLVDAALAELQPAMEAIKPHRQSIVTIEDGDFTAFGSKSDVFSVEARIKECTEFYIGQYSTSWRMVATDLYDAQVTVSGGTWGREVSAYLAPNTWCVENPDAQGTYIVQAAQENEAAVEADGSYFTTFQAAWSTAVVRASMGKDTTLKLKQNCETTTLNFPYTEEDATITLDLNGFTLSITQSSVSNYHIYGYNSSLGIVKLVISDKSETQSGELNLVYLDNAQKGGIYISRYSKFVLESGTIRRTGGSLVAESSYGSTLSGKALEYAKKAHRTLFTLYPVGSTSGREYTGSYETDMVVIKGGSILSEIDESQWSEGDHDLSFVCFEYGYNNYPSYTTTQYCLKFAPLDDYDINEDNYNPTFKFQSDDRKNIFKFDLEALDTYLDGAGKGCRFSWDLRVLAPELVWAPSNGGYIVTKQKEGDNYSVGGMGYATFAEALQKAQTGDTILVLNPDLKVDDENVVLDGVTLDLNTYLRYAITFTNGLTLKNGAAIKNGVVKGGTMIIDAHADNGKSAFFEKAELQCALTVNANADLVISEGIYGRTVTVQSGANLLITGGSFKGSQINALDQYFGEYLGALDESNGYDYEKNSEELFTVKLGPDLAAQDWYNICVEADEFTIKDTAGWKYFSLYVNSGIDNFKNKTIYLTADLNFDPNAASGVAIVAEAKEPNFLPAGNLTHTFQGSFDGGEHTIENIVAKEKFVGLFGRTTGVTKVLDLTLKNSTFTVGNGYLDSFNKGASYLYGGAIIGEAYNGSNCTNVTIEGVTVDQDINATVMSGAVVGHSWGTIEIRGLNMSKTSLEASWKLGGVVGFTEGSVRIYDSTITEITLGDSFFNSGVVAGHLSWNGSDNIIENCEIYTPDLNLVGTAYAGNKSITIDGAETYINVYALTGDNAAVGIEVSKEVTEEGVKRTTVITHSDEDNLTFTDEEGNDITDQIEQQPGGGFTATAKLDVSIGGITGETIVYSATALQNLKLSSFVLYDELGRPLSNEEYGYLGTFDVTVNLRESDYVLNSGKHVLLVVSYTVTGDGAKNFNFLPIGNQAFIEVDVQATALTVRVNSDGSVSYEGFVGGEDESVLGGELTLERVDNGDGTYTVTPSGLTSENYNITFVSGIVAGSTVSSGSNSNNALWIALAVVGSVVLALGAVTIVYLRKKRD